MDIAVSIWNNRISPVFDVSRQVLVVTVDGDRITGRRIEKMNNDDPFQKVALLTGMNIKTLICGAVSAHLHELMTAHGIQTLAFIAGEVDDVVGAFLKGDLPNPALCMPGCRRGCRRTNNDL
jgi:predicted Fe-Mo cluster-binding NifX family protein